MASSAAPTPPPVECPACPSGRLPDGARACPNCGTDVSLLLQLRALAGSFASRETQAALATTPTPARPGASSLAGLAIGTLLGALLAYALVPRASQPASVATMVTPPPTIPASPELRELERRLAGVPGLLVSRQDRDVVVAPVTDGFAAASASPDATIVRLVAGIAAAVRSGPARLRIEIHGHTDAATLGSGAPWRDNWSLGLARAEAVAQALRRALPDARRLASLAVASRGELPPDLPDATPRRTVVLRFSLEP